MDDAACGASSRELVGERAGAVGRVVVDDHQLEVEVRARAARRTPRRPVRDRRSALVVCGHDHRQVAADWRHPSTIIQARDAFRPVARHSSIMAEIDRYRPRRPPPDRSAVPSRVRTRTPPTPAGSDGNGSIAATRTCLRRAADLGRARSRTIVGHYSAMPVRLRSAAPRSTRRGAPTSWWRPNGSVRASVTRSSARGIATRRRRARPWVVRGLVGTASASCASPALGGSRALSNRSAAARFAVPNGRCRSTGSCRTSRFRGSGWSRGSADAGRSASDSPLRRKLHAAVGSRRHGISLSPYGATPAI